MNRDRLTRSDSIIGGLRLEKVIEIMKAKGATYAYVAGFVIRLRGDEVVIRNRQDAIDDFARRLYRGDEDVIVIDHGRVIEADKETVTVSISIPASGNPVPIHLRIRNPISSDDLVDLNEYFSTTYILVSGPFRYVRLRKRGRGYLVPRSKPVIVEFRVRELEDVPELVQLFAASGFLEPRLERNAFRRIRMPPTELDERYRDRVIGLEFVRRFGRFGPAMTVQISQPGYGKSSFYNRIRKYDSVSVFAVPPGKAILYSDERTRPPTPGRFFLDDVIVFDEVGDRDRARHTEKASLIRPELKASITNRDVARIAVLGNVITARGKPVFGPYDSVKDALAAVFVKVGIRQLEGRVDRITVTLTAWPESLHGKRKRSDYVLDPAYYRLIRKRYYELVDVRLYRHTISIARRRLNELGVEYDDELLLKATNPLAYASGVTVYEHMNAIEELGRRIRIALEKRLLRYIGDEKPKTEYEFEPASDFFEGRVSTKTEVEETTTDTEVEETNAEESKLEAECGETTTKKRYRSFEDVEGDDVLVRIRK